MTDWLLVCFNVALSVTAQSIWKAGVERISPLSLGSLHRALLSPFIIGGTALYVLATVVWLYLLSRIPLGMLYPLQSLGYIATFIVGILLFRENWSYIQVVGVFVILLGVVLITR